MYYLLKSPPSSIQMNKCQSRKTVSTVRPLLAIISSDHHMPFKSCRTKRRDTMQHNTSKRSAQCFCSRILSPFANVSNLLSSITEFIFSTHSASTSPSNTIYFRSFFSVGLLMSRNIQDKRPSVQSRVTGSRVP
jgi:hypothetical protein